MKIRLASYIHSIQQSWNGVETGQKWSWKVLENTQNWSWNVV